jgi:hypothetical protein
MWHMFRRRPRRVSSPHPRQRSPQWLARLLGPNEPELSCEECFAQLDRYVELEAAGIAAAFQMPRLAAHLRGCRACSDEHDDLLELVRSQDR